MGRSLARAYPEADACFDEASRVLGTDMRTLCWSAAPQVLAATENTQPALLTAAVAAWRAARSQGVEPTSAAGHSVGALAALVAAERLDFAAALRLAALRGRLMASAPGQGAMVAVMAHSERKRIDALMTAGRHDLDLAGDNSPRQMVFSGEAPKVDRFVSELGASAQKLRVSHAFHSRLMRPVAERWEEAVAQAPLVDGTVPVGLISMGRYNTDTGQIRSDLYEALCTPVRWRELMQALLAEDPGPALVGFGPAKALNGMLRHLPDAPKVIAADTQVGIESLTSSVGAAA